MVLVVAVAGVFGAPPASAAPANDDFAAAQVLAPAPGTFAGSTVGSSVEQGEPSHNYDSTYRSVWFTWTAPSDGSAVIKSLDATTPALAVYAGASLSALRRLSWNDDVTLERRLAVRVQAGTTYHLAVAGRYSNETAFRLSLTAAATPDNDTFASPRSLSGTSVEDVVDTTGATREGKDDIFTSRAGATVWWTWTAPSDGGLRVDTAGSDFPTSFLMIEYVDGDDPWQFSNWMSSEFARARAGVNVIGGARYLIGLDGVDHFDTGTARLALRFRPPPANDDFADATSLGTATDVTALGRTDGATAEQGEPFPEEGNSVWWTWTASRTQTVDIRAEGDGFAPAVALFTGQRADALTGVAAESGQVVNARHARVPVQAGMTYRVRVQPANQGAGDDLALRIDDDGGAPSNDAVADAADLAGSEAVTGILSGATTEVGEPATEGVGSTVWYRWIAAETGTATIDTSDSPLDVVTAVHRGSAASDLTSVASLPRAGAPGLRDFAVVAGQTYLIALDGRRTTAAPFRVRVTSSAAPGDGEPGDGGPGDGEPGDGEPGDGEPGDGEPGDGGPDDGKQPGDGTIGEGAPSDGDASPTVTTGGTALTGGLFPPVPTPIAAARDLQPHQSPLARPVVRVRLATRTVATLRRRGLRLSVACGRGCRSVVSVRLVVGGRSMALRSRMRNGVVTARLDARTRRRLAGARSATLRVRVTATVSGRTTTVVRVLRLTR